MRLLAFRSFLLLSCLLEAQCNDAITALLKIR
jgi:hypothetical protein